MVPSEEGGLEALPVIEPSGSDVEMSVDFSIQCVFMVDWGLFVLAARWSVAFPFLFASPASVVGAFRPCGPALSLRVVASPWIFLFLLSAMFVQRCVPLGQTTCFLLSFV